jgi:hypothetical protein
MRKDQCKFCTSRKCYERIVTPDMSFDEVACRRHSKDLAYHANVVLKGASRWNISSTGTMRRGERFEDDATQSAEKDAPMTLTDMPRPWSTDDMRKASYCLCKLSVLHENNICVNCGLPYSHSRGSGIKLENENTPNKA